MNFVVPNGTPDGASHLDASENHLNNSASEGLPAVPTAGTIDPAISVAVPSNDNSDDRPVSDEGLDEDFLNSLVEEPSRVRDHPTDSSAGSSVPAVSVAEPSVPVVLVTNITGRKRPRDVASDFAKAIEDLETDPKSCVSRVIDTGDGLVIDFRKAAEHWRKKLRTH